MSTVLDRKYVIVRANSTSGPYIIERNHDAPRPCYWSKADIAGYAATKREARKVAREANES